MQQGSARVVLVVLAWVLALVVTLLPSAAADEVDLDEACPAELVGPRRFDDTGDVVGPAVDCLAWWGIDLGAPSASRFATSRRATRAEMALLVSGTVDETLATVRGYALTARFGDVVLPDPSRGTTGTRHGTEVVRLATAGVVDGFADGTFRPGARVTRGQMARFVVSMASAQFGLELPRAETSFDDVDGIFEDDVARLVGAGITTGTTPTTYEPQADLTRGELALFMARTLGVLVAQGRAEVPTVAFDADPFAAHVTFDDRDAPRDWTTAVTTGPGQDFGVPGCSQTTVRVKDGAGTFTRDERFAVDGSYTEATGRRSCIIEAVGDGDVPRVGLYEVGLLPDLPAAAARPRDAYPVADREHVPQGSWRIAPTGDVAARSLTYVELAGDVWLVVCDAPGWSSDPQVATAPTGNCADLDAFAANVAARVTLRDAPVRPDGQLAQRETPVPSSRTSEGHLLAGGRSPRVGTGALTTYTVEIAGGLEQRVPLDTFSDLVVATLSDRDRGWTSTGARSLQRVTDPAAADVRVLLAPPATVDRLCARAGLDTAGFFSCWNGEFAALNADRWLVGVAHVDDLALYRRYLVNHEVGHGLGRGHRDCPAPGALAPVMMQLSKSTYGCEPNDWPHP